MLKIQDTGKLYGEQITLSQVSKTEAKKLYSKGETIYLQSSNMSLFNIWQSVCPIKYNNTGLMIKTNFDNELNRKNPDLFPKVEQLTELQDSEKMFNISCNEYSYYNCDNERGNYIHFFKSI